MTIKKKKNTPHRKRRVIIMLVAICMIAISAILYSVLNKPEPVDPLAFANAELARQQALYDEALERWTNRNFEDYRYQLRYGFDGDCILTIVVQDGIPSLDATSGSNCEYFNSEEAQSHLVTVDNLMGGIQAQLEARECGPNGCICDGYKVVRVEYNPTLGYPMTMEYTTTDNLPQLTMPPPSVTPEINEVYRCTLVGYLGGYTTILDLEPLPDEE